MHIDEDSVYYYGTEEDRAELHGNDQKILQSLKDRGILSELDEDTPSDLDPRRRWDVTGSDIATISGENPFETSRNVLMKKILHVKSGDNECTLHGKMYEPVAIAKVCKMSIDGSRVSKVYKLGYMNSSEYTWLGGTVDGVLELEDGRVMVLEVKCPLRRRIQPKHIPFYYMAQLQTYMFITGLKVVAFTQFRPGNGARKKEIFDVTLIKVNPWYIPLRAPVLSRFVSQLIVWQYIFEPVMRAAIQLHKVIWTSWHYIEGRPYGDIPLARVVLYMAISTVKRRLSGVFQPENDATRDEDEMEIINRLRWCANADWEKRVVTDPKLSFHNKCGVTWTIGDASTRWYPTQH